MTITAGGYLCDEPGCDAMLADADWMAGTEAGWRGYWTASGEQGELRHHCPAHLVETEAGEELDVAAVAVVADFLNDLIAERDEYRTALEWIAAQESGVWGQVARDALERKKEQL